MRVAYSPARDIFAAFRGKTGEKPIRAYFRGGAINQYTMQIFPLLKDDPDVLQIVDWTTGEVIFERS